MKPSAKDLIRHNLRRLRLEKGYTQKQLAERIHKTVLTVANLENGRSLPNIANLKIMAEVLDASIMDFFLYSDAPQQATLDKTEREKMTFKIRNMLNELSDEDVSLVYRQIQALVNVRKGD